MALTLRQNRTLTAVSLPPFKDTINGGNETAVNTAVNVSLTAIFVTAVNKIAEPFDLSGLVGHGRYCHEISLTITIQQWRKGAQWFKMDRDVAVEVISDTKYFSLFRKHCKSSCRADEHYLPTFVSIKFSERNSNRSLTWVDWSKGGLHPAKFVRTGVTIEILEKLRSGRICEYNGNITNVCFLFPRKLTPIALDRLMRFAPKSEIAASLKHLATQNMASSSRGLLTLFPDLNESTREITSAVALESQPSAPGFAPLTFSMRSVEQIMAAQSDIEANQYTLKSCVEMMTAVTNLSHRLQSRTNEVQQLNAQLALLQRMYKDARAEICMLKVENKELKRKATVMFRFGGPPYAAMEEQGGVNVLGGVGNTEATLSRAVQDGGKKKRPAEEAKK
ncbi:hypothetical protein TEA_016434 [Camellia sinensis var. sinensis]|uniref:Uncharacterized protein n=1 Tax=Camellia sinensis var. sinensis TaxID=542762 RepID=A0A4S4DA66_CAMSN|nr:hypothetical protein TEA_016434 [Camellia sinensis var. sinensis]